MRGRWPDEVARWLLVTIAMLGAACESSGGDDGHEGKRVDRDERESPLAEFFGSMDDASEERYAAQERRVEAEVVACMEAQGFEYTPMETSFTDLDEGPYSLPEKEFAEKYGLGMFTIDWDEQGTGAIDDPNQERIDAMSEAERIAYETALYGEFDEETGEVVGDGGCQGQAWDAEAGTVDEDEFKELFDQMDAVYDRVNRDDRVKDAGREWADCMADAGYPDQKSPDSVFELVQTRYEEMNPDLEEPEPSDDPEAASVVETEMASDDHGLDPAQLEELRAYEIDVAVADYECRAEYDDIYFEVQSEYEQDFVDEHRDELERYRDSIASTGSG